MNDFPQSDQTREDLQRQLNSLSGQLNLRVDSDLPLEQRASLVLRRLAEDRRHLLTTSAEALRTLALVLEAEQQIGKATEVYWTHADRKAIATLIIGMCKSRLAGSRWVDESVARLIKEDIAGEF